MADSANTDGEVDERDGMMVDWSDLTKEDLLIVAEVIAQQQSPEEPEVAAELPDDDESRAAAASAILDVLFNDTSSESDLEGFEFGEFLHHRQSRFLPQPSCQSAKVPAQSHPTGP